MPPGSQVVRADPAPVGVDHRHAAVGPGTASCSVRTGVWNSCVARLLDHRADEGDQRHGGERAAGQAERAQDQRAARQAGVLEARRSASPRSAACLRSVDGSSCRSWTTSSSGISHLAHSTTPTPMNSSMIGRAGRRAPGCRSGSSAACPGRCHWYGTATNTTMKPTPASAEIAKAAATAALGALLGLGAADREPLAAVDDVDAVGLGAGDHRLFGVIAAARRRSALGAVPCVVGCAGAASAGRRSVLMRLRSDPQDGDHQHADADDPDDDGLGHRADPVDAAAARVLGRLQRLDVGDDRLLLRPG